GRSRRLAVRWPVAGIQHGRRTAGPGGRVALMIPRIRRSLAPLRVSGLVTTARWLRAGGLFEVVAIESVSREPGAWPRAHREGSPRFPRSRGVPGKRDPVSPDLGSTSRRRCFSEPVSDLSVTPPASPGNKKPLPDTPG